MTWQLMWRNVGAAELKATLQLLVIYWLRKVGTLAMGLKILKQDYLSNIIMAEDLKAESTHSKILGLKRKKEKNNNKRETEKPIWSATATTTWECRVRIVW